MSKPNREFAPKSFGSNTFRPGTFSGISAAGASGSWRDLVAYWASGADSPALTTPPPGGGGGGSGFTAFAFWPERPTVFDVELILVEELEAERRMGELWDRLGADGPAQMPEPEPAWE